MLTILQLLFLISSLISNDLYVKDGDTIRLSGKTIRLSCIDAPEKDQPYGIEAKNHLSNLLQGKEIKVIEESTDRYGRILAWLVVEGDTINYKMVEDGYAWWYEYFCGDNRELQRLHNNAKRNKLGFWSRSNPINPYEWRKYH